MKIVDVEAIFCPLPIKSAIASPTLAGKVRKTLDMLLIKVTTDEGLVGWGESFAFYGGWMPARQVIEAQIAPRCVGLDPLQRGAIIETLQKQLFEGGRSGPTSWAISGLEIALWDLAGKALGVPVHALLGGALAAEVACYASLLRYGSVPAVIGDCERALARGFKAIKIHESGLQEIVESARCSESSVAGEFMVDVNCAWSPDEALAVCRGLTNAGVQLKWLEEPIYRPDDYPQLQRLRESCGFPIAAGENAGTPADFVLMQQQRSVDFVQPSVAKLGGIEAVCRVVDSMQGGAIQVALHSPFLGPALLASLHIVATRLPSAMLESYLVDTDGNPFEAAVVPANGKLQVPRGHGLGFDPDSAALRKLSQ